MATELHPTELMRFYDNYEAPLTGGSYRFVMQETVTVEGDEPRHYYRDQKFEVLAPRYSIEPDEVQAYFPPQGGVADYENVLPHLVLRARNLPWERTLWQGPAREPWLALLVFSDQDLRDGRPFMWTGKLADLEPHNFENWTRFLAPHETLVPKFTRTEDANTPLRLLDLDLKIFRKLCPRREELPLLAHIRHVDTADKIPLDMVANGEFSVLVANRFPQPGPNTVHLISLEGWEKFIETPDYVPVPRIRLITLANWSFICDGGGHDTFAGLMKHLRNGAGVIGKRAVASTNGYVQQALVRGYVPIDYQPLDSTPTIAWYRGPLSPQVKHRMEQPAYQRADQALIFDEHTGTMDVSYAAAWELGRLLALSSPGFSKGLRLFVEHSQNAAETARQIEAFLELHKSAFTDFKVDKQPGAEQVRLADELIEWIARLVMLYPVPFNYLIPHDSLLPPESMRFFYLDDNWIDALVDGALSIAVRGLPDQDVAARRDLQSTISQLVYQYRLRLQGKHPKFRPSGNYMNSTKTGFLLRSSLVTGWPGVEVIVTTDATDDPAIPKILRYEEVTEGVLFCLARGSIQKIIFREPREGLTFGVSSKGEVEGQHSINVKRDLRRSDSLDGVVNIAGLREKLASAGSAQFAVKMIRRPEEQLIEWK